MTDKLLKKNFGTIECERFYVGKRKCYLYPDPIRELADSNKLYRISDSLIWIGVKDRFGFYDVKAEDDCPPNFPYIYFYKQNLYGVDRNKYSEDEAIIIIRQHFHKQNEKFLKLQREIELFEKLDLLEIQYHREPIPEYVRFIVWRRDEGKCVKCGSNRDLEFDHIIPISKGGSNTERNIQILCEKCNREKASKI